MDENGAAYYIVKRAWEKCVEIGAASLGAVAAVLENCPPEVEREQVSALARIGGTIAIEQIIAHLDHGDAVAAAAEAVRSEAEAARRGLGVQGKGAAAPLPLHPRCRRKDHGPLQATADPD